MTYLPAHRARRLIMSPASIIVAGIIVLLILFRLAAPEFVSSLLSTLARPFWRIETSISEGSLRSSEALLAENVALTRQLDDASIRAFEISALRSENDELRKLLNRATSSADRAPSPDTKLAAVLVVPPILSYDEMIVDLGSDDGVSTTSIAYGAGSLPIGRIVSVDRHTSRIRLYSSPGDEHQATIGASNISAVIVGRGGGYYAASVSKGAQVEQGDRVWRLSSDQRPVGSVVDIVSDPAQAFETVLVAPPTDFLKSRWVTVSIAGFKK